MGVCYCVLILMEEPFNCLTDTQLQFGRLSDQATFDGKQLSREWVDSRTNGTNCGASAAFTWLLKVYVGAWSGMKIFCKYSKKQRCTVRETPCEFKMSEQMECMFPCMSISGHLMELHLVGHEQGNICLSQLSTDFGILCKTGHVQQGHASQGTKIPSI